MCLHNGVFPASSPYFLSWFDVICLRMWMIRISDTRKTPSRIKLSRFPMMRSSMDPSLMKKSEKPIHPDPGVVDRAGHLDLSLTGLAVVGPGEIG